jgi:putative hemolysin
MNARLHTLTVALILGALAVGGCTAEATAKPTETPSAGLPNPASVYCEEHGGRCEIRTAEDGSQYGVCIFPDGSECDEWAYFRGECQPAGATQ